jgi:predicted transcriptional regulator
MAVDDNAIKGIHRMRMNTISVRLDAASTERLDRIAEALAERAQGARITRSNALRVAVERGIELLESELNVKPKPKRK